jgi:hypothetical protein
MEATKKRLIKNGGEYDRLFPKAERNTSTIRSNANVTHTVAFIPKVVAETLHHTKQIAEVLKEKTTYKTCSRIWHFVYQHIAYRKDRDGYEEIRSPARAWHDRKQGVDCDCYSVFISSILTNLHIPHILRITKYHRDYFQHIYPVVLSIPKNSEIIMDCVTDQFNYEVPYSEKKDYPMDLQYLNGFDNNSFDGLGKLFAKKANTKAKQTVTKTGVPAAKKSNSLFQKLKSKKATKAAAAGNGTAAPAKKKGIKNILNKVNKINPATILLRNGILASMKLNIKNVAGRLRWSYLTPEQAAQKNIDPAKFQRLIAVRQKLENIFFGAGGKTSNLKQAILSGKGNKDKAVNGLNGYSMNGIDYMNVYTELPQLLGTDVYYSENTEGLGQLGEPITLATIAAATGVISGIIAALKQIGDVFISKSKGSEDFDEKTNEAAENNQSVPGTTAVPDTATTPLQPVITENNQPPLISNDNSTASSENTAAETGIINSAGAVATSSTVPEEINPADHPIENAGTSSTSKDTVPTAEPSFWDKNKNWLKPVAIGVGGLSLIAIGFAVLKPGKPANKSSPPALSGIPAKRKKYHRKTKHRSKPSLNQSKKKAIALL